MFICYKIVLQCTEKLMLIEIQSISLYDFLQFNAIFELNQIIVKDINVRFNNVFYLKRDSC